MDDKIARPEDFRLRKVLGSSNIVACISFLPNPGAFTIYVNGKQVGMAQCIFKFLSVRDLQWVDCILDAQGME